MILRMAVAGKVTILVVPAVADALKVNSVASLHLEDALQTEIRSYLDQYRLIDPPRCIFVSPQYIGVKVKAKIVPEDFHQPGEVQQKSDGRIKPLPDPAAAGRPYATPAVR